jgi:ribosomal protein L11 methyltransferase
MREEYIVPEGHKALYLDPGMAFGTGNHETTRLCIEALLKYTQEPSPDELATKRIIDAGCGSGILSLSAALLGYQHISAFDIDEDSIRISQENAALNNLENEVQFSTASLNTAIPKQSSDIILANILAPVLMKNATILLEGLMPAKGSILVLSGILKKEADAVASTFLDHAKHFSYNLEIIQQDDGIWSALCCRLL